jgi:hypothetical protein
MVLRDTAKLIFACRQSLVTANVTVVSQLNRCAAKLKLNILRERVEFILFSRYNGYAQILPTGKAVKGVS